ncbi:MAG: ceramidase [Proteobacteria bacterium]|nr:ceramidase [Pseudomonadota bacterium]
MDMQKKKAIGIALILLVTTATIVGLLFVEPISQDIKYHQFKDSKLILAIPNFLNVVSNIAFFIVGALGVIQLREPDRLKIIPDIKFVYYCLFSGMILVAFGSGYYHIRPDNQTLVWDRLPMTIVFMALFSIVISEFITIRIGKAVFLPLIICGISSVLYWHFTELSGRGDLRFYAIIQFLPMLLIPIILITFISIYTKASSYWWLLTAYIIAKLFEHFDGQVLTATGLISGHSIKHIAAAFGICILLFSYERRSKLL